MTEAYWLPIIFAGLMALSVFVYAILDGYDLGVGILLPTDAHRETDRDIMIASIGPFWDANETWLVLAIGIMLIAFPAAHSLVFFHLYLPTAVMLIGLILRGVAFDFRAKAAVDHKLLWDRCFKIGSLITALAQGYMLGQFVMGFASGVAAVGFSLLSAACVTAAYSYIGGCWLILKTEGALQHAAIHRTRKLGWITAFGVVVVCIVNPLVNPDIFARWFEGASTLALWLIPIVCFAAFIYNDRLLSSHTVTQRSWLPILIVIAIFMACAAAFCTSFYPNIVPGELDIWEAASAPESLRFILIGTAIVFPVILGYTAFAYWIFRGKATGLRYY